MRLPPQCRNITLVARSCCRMALDDHRHTAKIGWVHNVAYDVETAGAKATCLIGADARRVDARDHELSWSHRRYPHARQQSVRIGRTDGHTPRQQQRSRGENIDFHRPFPSGLEGPKLSTGRAPLNLKDRARLFFWLDALRSAEPSHVATAVPCCAAGAAYV